MKPVDADTGEKLRVAVLPDGAHLYIPKQPNNPLTRQDRRKFTKSYATAWRSVFAHRLFSAQETYLLMLMGSYCERESNAVVGDDDHVMGMREFAEVLGWSERNVRRILTTLQTKNAICKAVSGNQDKYFVNPELYSNGTYINATTKRLFEGRKQQLIDAGNILEFLMIGNSESTICIVDER